MSESIGTPLQEEPVVTIQGVALTRGQTMALRVACNVFLTSLSEGLGEDELGKQLTSAYMCRLVEILNLMLWKK